MKEIRKESHFNCDLRQVSKNAINNTQALKAFYQIIHCSSSFRLLFYISQNFAPRTIHLCEFVSIRPCLSSFWSDDATEKFIERISRIFHHTTRVCKSAHCESLHKNVTNHSRAKI
jgi:hypothetical protein